MPSNPDTSDIPTERLIPLMEQYMSFGFDTFVKWTCPECGERCAANEPNTFNEGGYQHTTRSDGSPCGATYHGDLYGFMAVMRPTPSDAGGVNV